MILLTYIGVPTIVISYKNKLAITVNAIAAATKYSRISIWSIPWKGSIKLIENP